MISILIYKPLITRKVDFNNVVAVYVENGMIALDEGKIPRVLIRLVFKNSRGLLAAIQCRCIAIREEEP
jgi:hypothetical protein